MRFARRAVSRAAAWLRDGREMVMGGGDIIWPDAIVGPCLRC